MANMNMVQKPITMFDVSLELEKYWHAFVKRTHFGIEIVDYDYIINYIEKTPKRKILELLKEQKKKKEKYEKLFKSSPDFICWWR